jgi:hypothetical protein
LNLNSLNECLACLATPLIIPIANYSWFCEPARMSKKAVLFIKFAKSKIDSETVIGRGI